MLKLSEEDIELIIQEGESEYFKFCESIQTYLNLDKQYATFDLIIQRKSNKVYFKGEYDDLSHVQFDYKDCTFQKVTETTKTITVYV